MKTKLVFVVTITILVLLLGIDMCDVKTFLFYQKKVCNVSNINIQFWSTSIVSLIGTVIAVFGTWYVTDSSAKEQMDFQQDQFSKEKDFQQGQFDNKKDFQKRQFDNEKDFQLKQFDKEVERKKRQEGEKYYLNNYFMPLKNSSNSFRASSFARGNIDKRDVRKNFKKLANVEGKVCGSDLNLFFEELYNFRLPFAEEFYAYIRLFEDIDFSSNFELRSDNVKSEHYIKVSKMRSKAYGINRIDKDYLYNNNRLSMKSRFVINKCYSIEEFLSVYDELVAHGGIIYTKKLIRIYNKLLTGKR